MVILQERRGDERTIGRGDESLKNLSEVINKNDRDEELLQDESTTKWLRKIIKLFIKLALLWLLRLDSRSRVRLATILK